MATPSQVRAPRQFAVGDDFTLWIRRFEAYARAVKIPKEGLSDALLALLDDAAFRAFDLLGLDDDTTRDFKLLTEALKKRFAPSTSTQELRFQLGEREQGPGETLEEYADGLINLANRAYPTLDVSLRMELARDRFIAGIRNERIQEALLQSPPATLDEAKETARRMEAAQAARKRMHPRRQHQAVNSLSSDGRPNLETDYGARPIVSSHYGSHALGRFGRRGPKKHGDTQPLPSTGQGNL